jgi:hypothetical protein
MYLQEKTYKNGKQPKETTGFLGDDNRDRET